MFARAYIYIYIYIEEYIFRLKVTIQASFVKDNGTLFIVFWAEDMGQFLYHLDPDIKKWN